MSENPSIYRSRWGFHPCDWATWQKIRRLRFLWFRTAARLAAWRRWANKLPHNRVRWKRIYNNGRPVGWEKTGPWHEPAVPPFMVSDQWSGRVLEGAWIEECYRQAKKPAAEPVEIWPEERPREIEALLHRLEEWYGGEG